jgi:cyclopropane-fatty-acyl-phospholipid synthase
VIGYVPDGLVRSAIRANCARRLRTERRGGLARQQAFVEQLRCSPIAEQVEKPNEQHYELPADFFQLVLGPRLKYSCCYWPEGVGTIAEAEEAMLSLTCERAGVENGMELLDLGCGWGSLSFWLAERYPAARILAVSNSGVPRAFIAREAARRGIRNLEVLTADANVFDTDRRFDRVISVEMLEHMRNYEELFARIASWLGPDGGFFVHVFSHRRFAYPYTSSWMARRFFTAGTMPSHDLLLEFQRDLRLVDRWTVDGRHYARSSEAWLGQLDERRDLVLPVLAAAYGPRQAKRWFAHWRIFFMACAELWGYNGGREWLVSHYLFRPR